MGKVSKEAAQIAEIIHEFMAAHKRAFHATAKDHGLSPQQAATIWNLEPGTGMPMSALADLLMCDASNVTGIVDKLEARGLAKRGQADDRRVKVLTLTEEGAALRNVMRERLLQPPEWLLALNRDDQRQLHELLKRGLEALRSATPR
ncbi:MAG: MarR family transcriptional regulator [Myxococcales bacterium]